MIDFEYCERVGRKIIRIIESRLRNVEARKIKIEVCEDGYINIIDSETNKTIHTVRVMPECTTIIANALLARFQKLTN